MKLEKTIFVIFLPILIPICIVIGYALLIKKGTAPLFKALWETIIIGCGWYDKLKDKLDELFIY